MKIGIVKKLLRQNSLEELIQAREDLIAEIEPSIEIIGRDAEEQLSNVLGAIYVIEKKETGVEENQAVRDFAENIRNTML